MTKPTYHSKETETDILRAICDYLALRKHFFWRNNNVPVYDTQRGAFRAMPKYTLKGLPDIELIKDSCWVGLEVKTRIGKQSPEQKEFEKRCKENGVEYYIVRSVEDVQRLGL
jgi:hypothetical protein